MNQRTQHRPSGIGAYKAELERIRIWIHSHTLKAMAKRNLIRTAGRGGSHQTYALRSKGQVIA